jgi:hypothetical protein
MTALNLALRLASSKISKGAETNFPELHFETYESPAAFGPEDVDKNAREEGFFGHFISQQLAFFSLPCWGAQSQQFESSVVQTSHSGEVARAKAIQRIGELNECAQEEQITINCASQVDLLKYISGYTGSDDLNIFLLDQGTFRLIWKTSAVRQDGLEFLGKGLVKETKVIRNLKTGKYSASSELKPLQVGDQF